MNLIACALLLTTAGAIDIGAFRYRSIFPTNTAASLLDPLKAEEGMWDVDVELYFGSAEKQPIRKQAGPDGPSRLERGRDAERV
jgi:hypothetical protein